MPARARATTPYRWFSLGDLNGYRSEFVQLVRLARELKGPATGKSISSFSDAQATVR